jgi:hypothetical protein
MSIKAKLDVDLVVHDAGTATFTVNSLSDHFLIDANVKQYTDGATVGTSAISITGPSALSTLVVKNEGTPDLRVAGAFNVASGRVAVLPVTATVTVASVSGQGSYSALWVG